MEHDLDRELLVRRAMTPKRVGVVVVVASALAGLGGIGVVSMVSRAAGPNPRMVAAQLSAITSAPQVSAAEAATVRGAAARKAN